MRYSQERLLIGGVVKVSIWAFLPWGRLLIEALGSALLGLGAILALGHVDAVVVGVAAVGVGVDDAHAGVDRVAALGVPVDSDAVDQSRAAAVRVPVEVGRLARAGGNW
jgi:hypothetical protein